MSDPDRLAEITAWWAAFDAGGWRDPKVEPLVQARTYIDWLIGEVERLQRYEAMWQDCRRHRDQAEQRARYYQDLYQRFYAIVREVEGPEEI